MNISDHPSNDKTLIARTMEITIHVGIVMLLLFWCLRIAQPSIQLFAWSSSSFPV